LQINGLAAVVGVLIWITDVDVACVVVAVMGAEETWLCAY
jgi:hypothetical protein